MANFEKLYGEPLEHLDSTRVSIADLDLILSNERDVKRAQGELFVLKDRKHGRYHFANGDHFELPKRNDYVILMSMLFGSCQWTVFVVRSCTLIFVLSPILVILIPVSLTFSLL